MDFRVEAFTGYWRDPMPQESALGVREQILVREESSGWSSIQTITITYDSSPSRPSQTITPSKSPTTNVDNNQTPLTQLLLGIIALLLCVIIILAILPLRRQIKTSKRTNDFVT